MIAMLGVPFVVRTADVDESRREGETPAPYLERVTQAKLDAVRATLARDLAAGLGAAGVAGVTGEVPVDGVSGVLVADTIVVAPDGGILGKPADDDDARAMIERLAGATHTVSTRFLLAGEAPSSALLHAATVVTRVAMRTVSRDEAAAYAATGEGRDKAGAYAVQGLAASFIERIEGSYTGVVGLPLSEVVAAMRWLGWW
jgi:septum formation protein